MRTEKNKKDKYVMCYATENNYSKPLLLPTTTTKAAVSCCQQQHKQQQAAASNRKSIGSHTCVVYICLFFESYLFHMCSVNHKALMVHKYVFIIYACFGVHIRFRFVM